MINYSIIIPHYNIPDLLGRCLRSIPERDDVQVIVVDDNSPGNDHYLETYPELQRKNVEFYPTKDGLGAGHVRNIGLSHAKGKWLVFSDSDDFFVEDFAEILDKYVNDPHDIIYFNIKSCDCYDITKQYPADKLRVYKETGNDIYLRICYTEPWGKFIKRNLVTDNNITFQETKAHNDLLFAVKTGLQAKTVVAVDHPLYWYVIREGSLGHNKGAEPFAKVCDRMVAWNSTQKYLERNGIKTKFYLPAWPLIRATKRNHHLFFSLMTFAKKNDISILRILASIIKYLSSRIFTGNDNIRFSNMLAENSVKSYAKKTMH